MAKLIDLCAAGRLDFRLGSFYPILCRLEDRGLITGRWIERTGERRRRYYKLTSEGRTVLAHQRSVWKEFVVTVNDIVRATSCGSAMPDWASHVRQNLRLRTL